MTREDCCAFELSLGYRKDILSQKSFFPENQVPPTTTEGLSIPTAEHLRARTQSHRGKMIKHGVSLSGTCRKLHLLEALYGWRDTVSLHQDVVLFPNTFMSLLRHAQDITWGCPTMGRQWTGKGNTVQYSGAAPSPVHTAGRQGPTASLCRIP